MNEGGVERWVQEVADGLSKENSVEVFQNRRLKNKKDYNQIVFNVEYDSSKGDNLHRFKKFFLDYQSLKVLQFTLKIIPRLALRKYDIVIPTDGGWEPAIVRILTWIKRFKMVIVGHAGIGWDDANNLWCLPDVFVALSEKALKWAEKINPFVKCIYIPDGVDINKFTPHGLKFKTKLSPPIVLAVGALSKEKGIDRIIRAVSKIPEASLIVCGKGPQRTNLEIEGNRLLGNRFELISASLEDMPRIYRSADLFVSASTSGMAFEMVISEAMSSGLPVIVNDDPIRRGIAGNVGIYTDAGRVEELQRAIRKAIGANAKFLSRNQAEKFSWTGVVASYQKTFEKLLGSSKDITANAI